MKKIIAVVLVGIVVAVLCTQITIFVIQPIGALPDGRTLIILRMNKTKFIDSADAMCERETGGVNLLCRAAMMAGVANNGKVLIRLPYSEFLYGISTGGKKYDR